MGSDGPREDKDLRRLWPILRPDEAQRGDQLLRRTVLEPMLLCPGYLERGFHCAGVQQQPTLLPGHKWSQWWFGPGQLPWRHAFRANVPGKPELPCQPDDVRDLLDHRRRRGSEPEALQTARIHGRRRLSVNPDVGLRGPLRPQAP